MTNSNIDLINFYDTVDLAKNDIEWASYALSEIGEKVESLKKKLADKGIDNYFSNLEQFVEILRYTISIRSNYWIDEELHIRKQLDKEGE